MKNLYLLLLSALLGGRITPMEPLAKLIDTGTDQLTLQDQEILDNKLIKAIKENNLALVKQLLDEGASLSTPFDKQKATALHVAAKAGHTEIAQLLIEKGANIEATTLKKMTPLHYAVGNKNYEVAQLFIKHKANINAKSSEGGCPLHLATNLGLLKVVQLLITNNAIIDAVNYDGATPLHFAAHQEHFEVAQLLITNKANVNARDKAGYTALCNATQIGHVEIVQLLITNGAEVDVRDNEFNTPLFWAARQGNPVVAQLLINNDDANINARNLDGSTALIEAIRANSTEVARVLITGGADVENDVDVRSGQSGIPLHWAAQYGSEDMINLLLSFSYKLTSLDREAANVSRRRFIAAIMSLNKKEIPLETQHKILLFNEGLCQDAAHILIDELKNNRIITYHSFLAYDKIKDATAHLILDKCSEHFNQIYENTAELPNEERGFFAPENRQENILPFIREGIDNRIEELHAMDSSD